jgi:hypothetical protein
MPEFKISELLRPDRRTALYVGMAGL